MNEPLLVVRNMLSYRNITPLLNKMFSFPLIQLLSLNNNLLSQLLVPLYSCARYYNRDSK